MSANGTGNALLDALPRGELDALRDSLVRVDLEIRDRLFDRGEPIDHVYFPIDCVASLISEMHDGRAVEVATVGKEGLVGLPVFLRAGSTSSTRAFCQVPGAAYRLGVGAFDEHIANGAQLFVLLQRYTQALFSQIAQNSACNRLHSLAERCARWLLMTHDRVGSDSFPLTQEFLAQMLGVQRTSVSEAAGTLQEAGLIEYSRGVITVVDRPGLEAASCECYGVIAEEFRRLVPYAQTTA